jgi:hypothetical protein
MICDRKCIYIHQPKTGGNTVANIIQDIVSDSSRVMGMHYTMREFVSRFSEIDLNEYTVLTVTRNPWERYASLHMQQYIMNILHTHTHLLIYFTGLRSTTKERYHQI